MRYTTITTVLAVAALGFTAQAQTDPGFLGGPDQEASKQVEGKRHGARRDRPARMTAEEATSVWTDQARSVASRLELDETQTSQLVEAYVAHRQNLRSERESAREERGEARRGARGEGRGQGEGRARGERRRGGQGLGPEAKAAMEAARTAFEAQVASFLTEAQTAHATDVLAVPNRRWDFIVRTIHGIDLDPGIQDEALVAIESFVSKTNGFRGMQGELEREFMRGAMREAREELRTDLAAILSEEELDELASVFDRSGRRGQGRRGGFAQLDANGDGLLQKNEVPERVQDRFDELDTDGDGALAPEEMAAMRRGRGQRGPSA